MYSSWVHKAEGSFTPVLNVLEILERETNSWKSSKEMIELKFLIWP